MPGKKCMSVSFTIISWYSSKGLTPPRTTTPARLLDLPTRLELRLTATYHHIIHVYMPATRWMGWADHSRPRCAYVDWCHVSALLSSVCRIDNGAPSRNMRMGTKNLTLTEVLSVAYNAGFSFEVRWFDVRYRVCNRYDFYRHCLLCPSRIAGNMATGLWYSKLSCTYVTFHSFSVNSLNSMT